MLKACYAILLLVCLGVKPFYTVGYVAYYELNIDYIVDKYCVNKSKPKFKCNGKCHLVKKISFASKLDSQSDKQAISTSLREAFFPVFYQASKQYLAVVTPLYVNKINWFYFNKNYNVSLTISSPPPQC